MGRTKLDPLFLDLDAAIVACKLCPRLRTYCTEVAAQKKKAYRDKPYWGKPVPSFGPADARLLVLGLAPAAHGANRTGRMFTGDKSGEWLYRALIKSGFAGGKYEGKANDSLRLVETRITAAAHCAPPGNRPTPDEFAACRPYLVHELETLIHSESGASQPESSVAVLVLGALARDQLASALHELRWIPSKRALPKFTHGAEVNLMLALSPNPASKAPARKPRISEPRTQHRRLHIFYSFHPSQQNTFTKRLTEPMFDQVFGRLKRVIKPRAQPL